MELYDLQADPGERVNLAAQLPAVRDSLSKWMDIAALESLARGRENPVERSLSKEERDQLLSLGYTTPRNVAPPAADSLAIWYFPASQRGPALGLADPRERLEAYNDRVRARSYAEAGSASLSRGDLAGAESYFRSALHFDPAQVEAHLGLSEIFARRGQWNRSILVLRHAAEQNPADSNIVLELSKMLADRGQSQEAITVLERAIHEGSDALRLVSLRDSLRSARRRTD
jgi:tetratricopeptide (TPR) repeat protein